MKDVVVAQITECKKHPTKPKYHLLKVTDGEKNYNILCGAPNVRTGLKAPLVKVGGMVSNITIAAIITISNCIITQPPHLHYRIFLQIIRSKHL